MSDVRLTRTLRIPQRELDAMLDAAEQASAKRTGASKRQARRWKLRGSGVVLTLAGQAGTQTHYLVAPRNLSSSGIGVVHGGFVHIGSRCVVSLRTKTGRTRSLEGKIVKCRLMRASLHDVGIAFTEPINPLEFVDPSGEGKFNVEKVDAASLTGRVLVIDDDRAMQKLMAHYFRTTKLEATYASDAEAGLQCLVDEPDIVFVDLHLTGRDGIEFIKEARAKHFIAPIILLTADTFPTIRARVLEAGGTEVLHKPIEQELVLQAIAEHVATTSGPANVGGLIRSSLELAPASSELVIGYIDELRRNAETMANHIEQNDLDAIRRVIMNIRGTASGHGFEPITNIAADAMKSLDATMSIEGSMPQLQSLMGACHRVRPPQTPEPGDAPPPEEPTV